jgi:Domain of unknown function (DUF3332)
MGTSRTLARWVGISLVALFLCSGCYGKSVLTTKVMKWHSDLKMNKWGKEGVFLPIYFFVVAPVAFVDYFILNSIDFWKADGDPLSTSKADLKQTPGVLVALGGTDAEAASWRMTVHEDRSVLEDPTGRAVLELRRDKDGAFVLADLSSGACHRIFPEELAFRER